ncbi:hypothetical protein [Arthrobacter nitrophenolicus]|uniref:hypothetical protein n=1 Tax=Arthrobacter nitrophenolicus TaxID=683150 RepID=UPI00034B049F|nr:hypothetical protein [Arthrobacter nitrophenolicus]
MPRHTPGTVLPALKRFAAGRRLLVWAVAAGAVLILAVSLVLAGNARSGPAATAGAVLDDVAAAQVAAMDRTGGYASLWLKGNDSTG